MTVRKLGGATIEKVEEICGAGFRPTRMFPKFNQEAFDAQKSWMVPDHVEPEPQGSIKNADQHQPFRKVWNRGRIDVIRKGHSGIAPLETFPICSNTREISFQLLGRKKRCCCRIH